MQRAFLVVNKETQIASYLEHRSIMKVTEEHRSLSEVDLEKIAIVDVEKFLYIYYQTDDGDLSFRSDMNALRNLLGSAFFHVSECLFILVNNSNPLLEDFIYSALRDSNIPRNKIEIIQHTGSLMLSDVGHYVSGSAAGQTTNSSYKDVFIREADKEEKQRYINTDSGINAVLPVLTDMASIYSQRANVEAISAGISVNESVTKPEVVDDFSRISASVNKVTQTFIVSGERWTSPERAVSYLVNYLRAQGQRLFIINLDKTVNIESIVGENTNITLLGTRNSVTPEKPVSVITARFDQLGYIIQFLRNVRGVEHYIFNVLPGDYVRGCNLISQLAERLYTVFVAHYSENSIEYYINSGMKSTALFLSFECFNKDFQLKKYKSELEGTIVAEFPVEDVDYVEFYTFSTGGGASE